MLTLKKFAVFGVVLLSLAGATAGVAAVISALPSHSYSYTLADGSTVGVAITGTVDNSVKSRGHVPHAQSVTWDTPSGQVRVTLAPSYSPPAPVTSSSTTSSTATSTTSTSTTATGSLSPTQPTDVTSWIAPGTFAPAMTDAQAAADVTLTTEAVPANTAANDYVPSAAEIAAFHANAWTQNPLYQYVDGLDGISNPSTDDLIQWVSHKWGIPTSWVRAQIRQESDWEQSQLGDELTVTPAVYAEYPTAEQVAGSNDTEVYTSMSLAQVKWEYGVNNLPGTGAANLRIESSAFALDLYGATVRYYYDGGANDWLLATQPAGDEWDSIGDWFSPGSPSSHSSYVSEVQAHLAAQDWPWSAPLS